jgi:flavin reductase (DIM6/NTAB) family NADH-FMN oxidoreductase RutF
LQHIGVKEQALNSNLLFAISALNLPLMTIHPKDIPQMQLHGHLLGAVSPRPICFASTIDAEGNHNLSPFSFFNIFGSNPVTLIFSPARRGRDNTIKHTLENVQEVAEVVINIVNYDMVQQMSLASCEYPKGVSEFGKAGFTAIESKYIKPMRVAESPVQLECKVTQVIETGNEGGAGNLVICEMLCMHINENVLDENGTIDPNKIDTVGRMGKDWYVRASGAAIFEVAKPNTQLGIGIDQLPASIKHSSLLTGNELGVLANVSKIPELDAEFVSKEQDMVVAAKKFLAENNVAQAWQALLRRK